MSENNLEPYFLAYIIIVFLCPWFIFAFHLIRELHFLTKNNKDLFLKQDFIFSWRDIKKFRKENPRAKYLYGKVKKWMVITSLSWIIGFLILIGIIFLIN